MVSLPQDHILGFRPPCSVHHFKNEDEMLKLIRQTRGNQDTTVGPKGLAQSAVDHAS
jgi:hypothetical protein